MPPISLGKGTSPARHGAAGGTRHVNCYIEFTGEDSKHGSMIVASDGLTVWSTLSADGIRAMIEVGPFLYVVAGRQVYRLDPSGTATVLGGFPTDGPVYMKRNRREVPQIGIVSDGLYYVIDTGTGTLTQVSDADLPPALSLAFLDGYGILPGRNGKWFTTALDDFTSVDPLEFDAAQSNPDEILRAETREGEVVLFGTASIEWWQDTGGADFAFTRSQASEIGSCAAGSVCKVERTLMWAAHDYTVRMMEGYGGKVVSNEAVSRAIEAETDKASITSTSWFSKGHTFYCLNLSTSTWVYDVTTNQWHNRESYGSTRWRVDHVCRFGDRLIAGDATTGNLYIMSDTAFSEGAHPLISTIRTPPVHGFPHKIVFNALYLDILPGVGLNSTAPELLDPEMMIRWSDDGGSSWSAERRVALGRLGQTVKRGVIRRLGRTTQQGRIFEFSVSAAVARAWLSASVDIEELAA